MSKTRPLVSVCIQTYNHKDYIATCLDSILNQETDFKFEIILGEDESNDGTRTICKEYAKKHPEKIKLYLRRREDVIYMFGKPTGRYNMVENISAAKGKYIAICEGDDFWTDSSKLQQQIDYLEKHLDAVGSFHNASVVDEKGFEKEAVYFNGHGKTIFNQSACLKDLKSRYATASLVFRATAIKNKLERLVKIGSDFILDIFITEEGDLHYMDKNMSAYRVHGGGIWQGNSSIHNLKVDLARHIFLFNDKTFKNRYNNYLWTTIISIYDKIIDNAKTLEEQKKYKKEQFFFLNFNEKRTYTFLLRRKMPVLFDFIVRIKRKLS